MKDSFRRFFIEFPIGTKRFSLNQYRYHWPVKLAFLTGEAKQKSAIRSVIYGSVSHSTRHHRLHKFAPVVILIHEMNISNWSIFATIGAHRTRLSRQYMILYIYCIYLWNKVRLCKRLNVRVPLTLSTKNVQAKVINIDGGKISHMERSIIKILAINPLRISCREKCKCIRKFTTQNNCLRSTNRRNSTKIVDMWRALNWVSTRLGSSLAPSLFLTDYEDTPPIGLII